MALVAKDNTTFELFEFHDPTHPQVEFIRNHVAMYSDNIEQDVDALINQGFRLTIPITERVIFKFAYLQDKSGTNYEIATEKTGA